MTDPEKLSHAELLALFKATSQELLATRAEAARLDRRLKTETKARLKTRKIAQAWQARAKNDPLTGLSNKSGIGSDVDRLFRKTARANKTAAAGDAQSVVLMLFDVDHFKSVNTAYGHKGGDDALISIAAQARQRFSRPDDVVGRDGGDEFLVAFACPSREVMLTATYLAESLRTTIEENCQIGTHTITSSIGVAFSTNADIADRHNGFAAMKKRADRAQQAAKDHGRNAVWLTYAEGLMMTSTRQAQKPNAPKTKGRKPRPQ